MEFPAPGRHGHRAVVLGEGVVRLFAEMGVGCVEVAFTMYDLGLMVAGQPLPPG